MVKISLIGAGSGCFSVGLVRELCASKHLSGSLVSLMDVNPERLDAVHNLCLRFTREIGGTLRFEKTLDRVESLKGADYVINTALTAPPRDRTGARPPFPLMKNRTASSLCRQRKVQP